MTQFLLLFLAGAAVLAAWLPARWRFGSAAVGILLLMVAGLVAEVLAPLALVWCAVLFGTAWWAGTGRAWRRGGYVGYVLAALGIGFGVRPSLRISG